MTYRFVVELNQAYVLEELEWIIGKPIPQLEEINDSSFGFLVKDRNIIKIFRIILSEN